MMLFQRPVPLRQEVWVGICGYIGKGLAEGYCMGDFPLDNGKRFFCLFVCLKQGFSV